MSKRKRHNYPTECQMAEQWIDKLTDKINELDKRIGKALLIINEHLYISENKFNPTTKNYDLVKYFGYWEASLKEILEEPTEPFVDTKASPKPEAQK